MRKMTNEAEDFARRRLVSAGLTREATLKGFTAEHRIWLDGIMSDVVGQVAEAYPARPTRWAKDRVRNAYSRLLNHYVKERHREKQRART